MTICLKVILQNNDIVRWDFLNSPLQYGYYIQTFIVFHCVFLLPTQWASLYYFMRIYTMWFLPHFFSCCDLFTFKKFCRSLRLYIFSFWQAPWQLQERQWEIIVWSSAKRKIYLHIDLSRCISLYFPSASVALNIFSVYQLILCPYFGAS